MAVTTWLAIGVFAAAIVLIATEWIPRVATALGGAVLMLLIGATDAEHAFYSEDAGIDWNVIFLLLGMMLIVAVVQRTGVFEYLAIRAAKLARGRPYRLMVLLSLVTGFLSAWLDNVTTVLLIAPVTIAVCQRLALPIVPYLLAEIMACNIGGAATLIGDPPNIIIGSRGNLSFNDFLVHMTPIAVLLLLVFCLLARVLFRSAFRYDPERAQQVMAMDEREAIRDARLLAVGGVVVGLVMACFVLHTALHLEPSVVAMTGGLALLALSHWTRGGNGRATAVLKDVEWETLAFFAGLFVMVGALVRTGVIGELGEAAARATDGDLFTTSMTLVFGSVLPSASLDNIPFVASVSPIVAEIVNSAADPAHAEVLWWSFALGADLAGNLTIIASSANVVVVGIAERHGQPISFWRFTRYGAVVTVVTVAVAGCYVALRYFALA